MIYLDTHVVVWLYDGEIRKLSKAAAQKIQGEDLFISPAVILELQFLHEIQRLRPTASTMVATLAKEMALQVSDLSFIAVVESATEQKWVRDPFDRLIVAQAAANDAPLVTKDERIRKRYRHAIW